MKAAHAWDYVLGLTCVNDVTARDLQKKESQYTRCKGFDTFAPIGPAIATGLNGEPRGVEGWVNDERRQASSTRHLIFPIEHLIEFITFVMTLEPGDIISTGTPEGIGPVKHGDTVTIKVEGVGELDEPGSGRVEGVMKLFIDSGNIKDIETLAAHRHHRRRHDQPVAAGEGAGRLPREPEEDLPDRQGAGQRRGDGDRFRRHAVAGARHREDRLST